ncbi:MAG: hypothetical protein K0Q55_565 [Verrucomicrobia bacterium]|jgi:serine/threonine protein kinase|nr:hypothetical protein [Verrucomicrobiota bacterium]
MSLPDDERDESPTVLRHYPGEQILHRFTLERELAGGGMGVVWLARDEELNRRIALKFLPDRVRNDLAAIQHLKSEAIKSIELAHPHIVRIYDFLYDRHNAAISMEFVDGETLSSLRKARPSRVFEAYDLRTRVRQLCSALEYAHEVAEIVHRDLKPANLMVNRRDQLKVTDFGIASSLQLTKGKQESSGGTPGYMSPQQAARHAPSVLDDVYSLGATIYDLLTGRPPYYDEERKQNVAHLPDSRYLTMQERRHQMRIGGEPIPKQWEEAVAKCLEYQPSLRPQSIREVADLLGLMETTTRPSYQVPEAPTGLKARPSDKRVSLTWNPSPGALTYQIKRAPTVGGPYTVIGTVNDATEFSDTTVENGTVYYYTVEAANNVAASPLSGEVKGEPQAPPAPPVNLRARVTDRTVLLEWDPATGATRYIIKRASKPDEPFTVIATVTTGTRFQDGGVENDVTYRYLVESVNSVGLSTAAEEFQVTPCPLLRAPLDLTLTPGDRSISLKWRGTKGAAAYRVLRSEISGGPFYELKTLDSSEGKTSYVDKEVHNGSTYYYVIEALNAAGASPHSNEARGEPQAPPAPPVDLAARVADRTVILEWAAAKGAVSYQIKRADKSGDPFKIIATVTNGTRFQDGGVENDITYRYVVVALSSSGLATPSGELRATPCPLPKAPLGMAATAGDEHIRLSWRKVPEAVAYHVLRSDTAGGPYQTRTTLEEKTHFEDEKVINGRAYYYVIESLNAAGTSPQSHEVWAVPMPVPQIPMGIRVEAQEQQVLISWAASSHATGYNIQRSLTSGGPYTSVGTVTTGTSYLDPHLENGSTYYYVLLAFNSSGYSAASQEVSACPGAEIIDEPVVAPPPPAPARPFPFRALAGVALVLLLAVGGWFGWQKYHLKQGLEVTSQPTGAQVFIDGKLAGTTPFKAPLTPEDHNIRVVLDDYDPHEQPIKVNSNDVVKISAHLNRSKGYLAIIPRQPGRYDFKIKNDKGDLAKAGTTEAKGSVFDLETGTYTVEVENPGWDPLVEKRKVERGSTNSIVPDFEPAAVTFTSDPKGAEIIVAEKSIGKTPLTQKLPPGKIKVRAHYPDLSDKEETITVVRGDKNEYTFKFDYGSLLIRSTPENATVLSTSTGELLGQTPYVSKAPLPEGTLDLVLQLPGYERWPLPVKIQRGQTSTQTVTLVKVTAPKGTLFVDAVPPNATVFLDKERWGISGQRIPSITPGRYKLRLEHEGYEPSAPVDVEILANQTSTTDKITLQRSRGTLQIASLDPSARYLVRDLDGKVAAQGGGATNLNLPTGDYQVTLERNFWEQKKSEQKNFTLQRNLTVKLEPAEINAGTVEITSDPPGTEILWENLVRTTNSKARLELPVGANVLIARHPILGDKPLEIKTVAGKTTSADFRFDYGSAEITSRPEGADVLLVDARTGERKLGTTPYRLDILKPGSVSYLVRKPGFRPKTVTGLIQANSRSSLNLEASLDPMVGSLLVTSIPSGAKVSLGNLSKSANEAFTNIAVGTHTVTVSLADYEPWQTNLTIQDNKLTSLNVQLTRSTGGLFIDSQPPGATFVLTSLTDPSLKLNGITPQTKTGLPVGNYRVELAKGDWKLPPFNQNVERRKTNTVRSALPFGYLSVAAEPAKDTTLEINGTALGPLLPGSLEIAVGSVTVKLKALGYKPFTTNFNLSPQQNAKVNVRLEPAYGPQFGQRWTKSLGLIFVPLGRHHLCITETRRMDFEVFEKEAGSRGGDTWKTPQFPQTPADPVVNVNYDDAKAFAEWLTQREKRFKDRYRLEEQSYRLPTDEEWSQAVSPPDGLFIWGSDWPPPSNAGNFYELLSYDGFSYTAPVAYFRPNRLGIYDLAGNVWEWCEVPSLTPVLRGGSWLDSSAAILDAGYRLKNVSTKEKRRDTGFRLLLDSGKAADVQAAK